MLSYGSAFYGLKELLQQGYDANEAAAISHTFMEYLTGLGKLDRLDKKDERLTPHQQEVYENKTKELAAGKPVQYVTGTAWFMGREFYVNEHVLIPRPETEELVEWIVEGVKNQKLNIKNILDIGTGSGCIPISLKLAVPEAEVTTCDVSADALATAKVNAGKLGAEVALLKLDFLDTAGHNKLGMYDVIVSNPPYIPAAEQERLDRNVRDFEPGIALFVPDDDALVFYRAIADFGKTHLSRNGCIYCELDAAHAEDCKILFEQMGYNDVQIKKDMHGNWRMLKAGN
jgi:release factor glutamine methyltransferase